MVCRFMAVKSWRGSVSYGMFSSGGFVKARLLVAVEASFG